MSLNKIIQQRNDEIEKEIGIYQEMRNLEGKQNVEKLKFFNLISDQRINDIKNIHFKDIDFFEWEENKITLKEVEIETRKIVGTGHPNYSDISLYEALNNLKKFDGVLSQYLTNPSYYYSNGTRTNNDKELNLIYRESEDRYYINSHANNRFITALAMDLDKVLVNKIEVFSENKQLKRIHQWMTKNKFKFKTSSRARTITLESEFFCVKLYSDSLEKIESFISKYEKLNVSNKEMKLYKLRAFFCHNYKDKYKYTDDIIHLYHKRYLEIREHKIKNS